MNTIKFREMVISDAQFVKSVRDKHLHLLHTPISYSVSETERWIQSLQVPYYIIERTNEKLGYFRVSIINDELYFGIDLDSSYIGKGLAFDISNKFISYISIKYNVGKIYLEVLEHNIRAIKFYKKLGFQHINPKPLTNSVSLKMMLKLK